MNLSTQPTWTAPDAQPRQADMTTPDPVDTMWHCAKCGAAWGDGVTPSECPTCVAVETVRERAGANG